MARSQMAEIDTAGALARYRLVGRLLEVQDPSARAAELLIADPDSIGIVADADQEQRLRQAVAAIIGPRAEPLASREDGRSESQAEPMDAASPAQGGPAPPLASLVTPGLAAAALDDPASRIMQADAAYEARRRRREAWLDQGPPRNERHLPEPGTIARAYVVAADPYASPELTRAVSVAAESHLLTTPLRPWLAREVDREAKRLQTAEKVSKLLNSTRLAEREQQARRQAKLHRELAYERPRHSLAAHEAERAADREAER